MNDSITFVTALLDIKRGDLESASFQRGFQRYLENFSILLRHLQESNFIIYLAPENFQFVKDRVSRDSRVILRPLTLERLRESPYFEGIQRVRHCAEWCNQVGWLADSTQAKLEYYNPLIFQKIHFLNEVATENLYNTDFFIWVDAGIANAQAHPGYFSKPNFEERITPHLDPFLFLCFPYQGHSEIHGFTREGMRNYIPDEVTRVARGTFFGGRQGNIAILSENFFLLATDSLEKGLMGTEESIFTLLTYLQSDKMNIRMVGNNGLISSFFEQLQNQVFTGQGTIDYKNSKMQQHPNTVATFEKFFKINRFDLIIEIGTGHGGLSAFLHTAAKKMGGNFITYDLHQKAELDGIDFRQKNIFDDLDNITNSIKGKRTLILCDGGSKILEFRSFADLLAPGDVIMANDYAPDSETFKIRYKNQIWNWHEIQDSDIAGAVRKNNLIDLFPSFAEIAWVCKEKRQRSQKVDLYVLTFNSPRQFDALVKSMQAGCPRLLEQTDKYVLNNTTLPGLQPTYEKLFESYGFSELRKEENIGICGGRQFIAEHFATTLSEYMFFFEDDMMIVGPGQPRCPLGFNRHHDNLYNDVREIMDIEHYDFLKLSFKEFYGDNSTQWSWYNVRQEFREKQWPEKSLLPLPGHAPHPPLTQFKNVKSHNGLPYADGQIYYCNWPQIISKHGSEKVFLKTKWAHPAEQAWMSRTFEETVEGNIHSAVLLLSPINHHRFDHYNADSRRES